MASIYARKRGAYWEYRIYFGVIRGTPKTISHGGFRTKKQALAAAEEALLFKGHEPKEAMPQKSSILFEEYLMQWLNRYGKMNLKETTVHGYLKRIQTIITPKIGKYRLNELTPMILQSFLYDVYNEGYGRNALSTIKGILTSSLRYAVSMAEYLAVNPALNIQLPHTRSKPTIPSRKRGRQPITAAQWDSLMERFPRDHPSHIPLNLGYHLGLRLGEAFGLCWEDVDFENCQVTIQRQVQYDYEHKCWYFTQPKYDSVRTVYVGSVLMSLLADEYDRQKRAKDYFRTRYHQVFVNADNQFCSCGQEVHLVCVRQNGSYIQPRALQHTMRVAHAELDMPLFDFHTLRHTHATMLLEAGANMLDIQQRLGHSKIEMTRRYTHNTDAIRSRTLTILNSLYKDD